MTFALTDLLKDEITSALENQEKNFLVDAQNAKLIEDDGSVIADEDLFYTLPEWNSAQGFKLREDFVSTIRIPVAKEELQDVLHSGRGVFRNFRLVLKNYPEVEKRWHLYKNRIMQGFITDWYNELREIWGLEKLDYLPENDETLVHDDFSFRVLSEEDIKIVIQNAAQFFREEEQNLPEELIAALSDGWKERFISTLATKQTGYICYSLSEEFAGCITAAPITSKQEEVMVLTSLFVPDSFRGLGIGTELISMCLSKLQESGKKWLIMPGTLVPEILYPMLIRNGFIKTGTGYAVKLQ